jgi:hypothetical protein
MDGELMKRILGALALVVLTVSCAHPRTVAIQVDSAIYAVLVEIHQEEQQALCGQPSCANVPDGNGMPGWTREKSQAFNQRLAYAAKASVELTKNLQAWKPGQPISANVRALIESIGQSLAVLIQTFPDGPSKTDMLSDFGKAQQLALSIMADVLDASGGK